MTLCSSSEKDAGTSTVNTPLSLLGLLGKWVGCIPSNSVGSMKLSGPNGTSSDSAKFKLKYPNERVNVPSVLLYQPSKKGATGSPLGGRGASGNRCTC